LGLTVQRAADDSLVIPIPKMTQEKREDMIKSFGKWAETAKNRIRSVRRDALAVSSKALSVDNAKRVDKQVQKVHDQFIKKIDDLIESKRKEIMSS
jgi:ribosome recycling factor